MYVSLESLMYVSKSKLYISEGEKQKFPKYQDICNAPQEKRSTNFTHKALPEWMFFIAIWDPNSALVWDNENAFWSVV